MAIKQSYETAERTTFITLFYGQPDAGKSTLACSATRPVVIDFDGGYERVNIQHRQPYSHPATWDEAVADTREAIATGCKTLVIDTVGRMIESIETYIKTTTPAMVDKKGGLTLKGFGVRKQIFGDYISQLRNSGVNVIFIAQETESDEDGRKIRRPAVGSDKMATELLQDIDVAGYLHIVNGKRCVEFGKVDYAWTKNCIGMQDTMVLPNLANAANTAFGKVEEQFCKHEREKVAAACSYAEKAKRIDDILGNTNTAEELTLAMEAVNDIELTPAAKDYARQQTLARARFLGLRWNKETNEFEINLNR